MTVNILGTPYTIEKINHDDSSLCPDWVGYCDSYMHRIAIVDLYNSPDWQDEPKEKIERALKETLRHEIVHAFFNESGLKDDASSYGGAWCRNEEMIDWLAIQGVKIMRAWQEADCI